jgi:hypothetical protein
MAVEELCGDRFYTFIVDRITLVPLGGSGFRG